jgi:hypothetical protein
MIGRQTRPLQLPPGFLIRLVLRDGLRLPIRIIFEAGLPPVAVVQPARNRA